MKATTRLNMGTPEKLTSDSDKIDLLLRKSTSLEEGQESMNKEISKNSSSVNKLSKDFQEFKAATIGCTEEIKSNWLGTVA